MPHFLWKTAVLLEIKEEDLRQLQEEAPHEWDQQTAVLDAVETIVRWALEKAKIQPLWRDSSIKQTTPNLRKVRIDGCPTVRGIRATPQPGLEPKVP
jgi:hypothetical protein